MCDQHGYKAATQHPRHQYARATGMPAIHPTTKLPGVFYNPELRQLLKAQDDDEEKVLSPMLSRKSNRALKPSTSLAKASLASSALVSKSTIVSNDWLVAYPWPTTPPGVGGTTIPLAFMGWSLSITMLPLR